MSIRTVCVIAYTADLNVFKLAPRVRDHVVIGQDAATNVTSLGCTKTAEVCCIELRSGVPCSARVCVWCRAVLIARQQRQQLCHVCVRPDDLIRFTAPSARRFLRLESAPAGSRFKCRSLFQLLREGDRMLTNSSL
ncbi:hypothetical protein EVAR_49281_1 [Eumeta japonica]|uniref:Uncharacterized protein n=1 Tax=Eumeta variegata TaxID=151549 RepID=A0A4C1XQK6_EUMVA|nr:hypothetical protein EVAR_49281_1 [Eumeta japonica]